MSTTDTGWSVLNRTEPINFGNGFDNTPDDGSPEWYMNFIMGFDFRPTDKVEIENRIKSMMPRLDVVV